MVSTSSSPARGARSDHRGPSAARAPRTTATPDSAPNHSPEVDVGIVPTPSVAST